MNTLIKKLAVVAAAGTVLSLVGVESAGAAASFGAFFKRQTAKKQKKGN